MLCCRNFYSIASGQNQQGFSYRGTIFHRIIPQFMIQVTALLIFINSLMNHCFRVEILRILMARADRASMVPSSMTRTSW